MQIIYAILHYITFTLRFTHNYASIYMHSRAQVACEVFPNMHDFHEYQISRASTRFTYKSVHIQVDKWGTLLLFLFGVMAIALQLLKQEEIYCLAARFIHCYTNLSS